MGRHILTDKQIDSLMNYLGKQLKKNDCDGTLKYTMQWMSNNITKDKHEIVLEELEHEGGFCDCEVIMNCYQDL